MTWDPKWSYTPGRFKTDFSAMAELAKTGTELGGQVVKEFRDCYQELRIAEDHIIKLREELTRVNNENSFMKGLIDKQFESNGMDLKKTEYVLGFAFNPSERFVMLVSKKRPAWQAGRLNGIGGKVEEGETYVQAMEREFREEAGPTVPAEQWTSFGCMEGTLFKVEVFRTTLTEDQWARMGEGRREGEDEPLIFFHLDVDSSERMLESAKTLLEMARTEDAYSGRMRANLWYNL